MSKPTVRPEHVAYAFSALATISLLVADMGGWAIVGPLFALLVWVYVSI